MSLHRIDLRGGGTVPERRCHVYVVVGTDERKPTGDCHECGQPLSQHHRRVSGLVPADGVWTIDETAVFTGLNTESTAWETTAGRDAIEDVRSAARHLLGRTTP